MFGPRHHRPPPPFNPAGPAPMSPKQWRILMFEDCPTDAYITEALLESAPGFEHIDITNVSRLSDGFKLLNREAFDIILLDLNLLDIDGISSVSALKAEFEHIPLIVYSGTDSRILRDEALFCGAAHYLVKGHDNGLALRQIIRDTLEGNTPRKT